MALVEKQNAYFFNSSPTTGATPVGSNGNVFRVILSDPISIPSNALYASLEVISARVWFVSPNISAEIGNNHIRFSYDGTGQSYDFEIPDGSYGVQELDVALNRFFSNNGLPTNLFIITANDATQTVNIKFGVAGVFIDFQGDDTCREVLGFASGEYTAGAGANIPGIFTAKFNRIENYLIKSDIVSSGIPQNNVSAGIIAEIPIDAYPGDQIRYSPINPLKCDASSLIGKSKQSVMFHLLDQEMRDVSTAGEYWSITVVIKYHIQLENNISHVGNR
jgi:hypothetical protein